MKKRLLSVPDKGFTPASKTFYIKVTAKGPYLVYGNPPIDQEIIVPNEEGTSWEYRKGKSYATQEGAVALCRCGESCKAPFCDGSHTKAQWDPQETADRDPILSDIETFEGPEYIMADNEKYCAFARFCDAYGRVWNIVEQAETDEDRALARHEVSHCPSGRLMLYDKVSNRFLEPPFEPAISILEDEAIGVSGPIWIKGGIRIESADGSSYEIRNRVTLCRCGQSSRKPFCDGTHASSHYKEKTKKE